MDNVKESHMWRYAIYDYVHEKLIQALHACVMLRPGEECFSNTFSQAAASTSLFITVNRIPQVQHQNTSPQTIEQRLS